MKTVYSVRKKTELEKNFVCKWGFGSHWKTSLNKYVSKKGNRNARKKYI